MTKNNKTKYTKVNLKNFSDLIVESKIQEKERKLERAIIEKDCFYFHNYFLNDCYTYPNDFMIESVLQYSKEVNKYWAVYTILEYVIFNRRFSLLYRDHFVEYIDFYFLVNMETKALEILLNETNVIVDFNMLHPEKRLTIFAYCCLKRKEDKVKAILKYNNLDPNVICHRYIRGTILQIVSRRKPWENKNILRLLLADYRVMRISPPVYDIYHRRIYDQSLIYVKRKKKLKFSGLVRGIICLLKLKFQALETMYAPPTNRSYGGSGYQIAEKEFNEIKNILL